MGAGYSVTRELHPLKSSAFHGALFRQSDNKPVLVGHRSLIVGFPTVANRLRSPHLIVGCAWAMHAISWFVPVVKPDYPGYIAFRLALLPIWPSAGIHADYPVLALAGALTTILFIIGSPWAVWRGSRSMRKASAWVAIAAFVFKGHWYFFYFSERKGLSVGYFLWWFSFILLAVGLFGLSSNGEISQCSHVTEDEAGG